MTYYYRKLEGKQAQLSCVISKSLPANFTGSATFRVQTTGVLCSATSCNFLVNNGNPLYTLVDEDPTKNSAALEYCNK